MKTANATAVRWTLLAIQILCLPLTAAAQEADDPGGLADEAIQANPSLEALRARIAELDAVAGAAGTWTDPVIGVDYLNAPVDTFSIADHPMGALQVRATQTIPPWGWSRLREEVAASRTLESQHALGEAQAQLRREVFELYWRLTLSRMLGEVTREHAERTEDLLEAVRARYETGNAGQHQVLRLQVLRDRLRDDLGDFVRADRVLSAALSRALSRDRESRFATAWQLSRSGPWIML